MVCQIGFNFLVNESKWQIGLIRSDEVLIKRDASSDFMVVCPGFIQLNAKRRYWLQGRGKNQHESW